MKRLIYSPRTEVFIKADSGIYDISPFVTEVSVTRKVNQVSHARVAFRNPKMHFTEHQTADGGVGPIFHPMDPIIISMTRIRNRPIQVFTGYCDTTPYFQLFPGPCIIEASCTLKRLQYTYFDPGLQFFWEFLAQYGWSVTPTGIMATDDVTTPRNDPPDSSGIRQGNDTNKSNPVTDQGFAGLLMAVLTQIGGWDPKNVFIEDLPQQIPALVTGLFETFKQDSVTADAEFTALIRKIIGSSSIGGAGSSETGSAGGAGPAPKSQVTPVEVGRAMLTAGFPSQARVLAQGMAVVNVESSFGAGPIDFTPNSASCVGYWQLQYTTHDISIEDCNDLVKSTKKAHELWQACEGGSFACDWYRWEGSASSTAQNYQPYLDKAQTALQLGPFTA